jgi:hypothetical protein
MKIIILPTLILIIIGCSCNKGTNTKEAFSSFETAKLHPVAYDRPAPDFFEGALLGNGAMGVVVTTRPDAVVLYTGCCLGYQNCRK